MLLYYITDRRQFPGSETAQQAALLQRIGAAAAAGVDLIQLREKDLATRALLRLTREALQVVRENSSTTRLLVNSRCDVAAIAGADGVHLPANDLAASDARAFLVQAGVTDPTIGNSCHTVEEIAAAEAHGADFAVFGPVFEKSGRAGTGVAALRQACKRRQTSKPPMPVLALGGVSVINAEQVLKAGAAGVAGIRLFQSADVRETVALLRLLQSV